MENATFNISFFCRNARLSLQKAAFSRRSHMLSEELEHLRNFESVVLETLPRHPLYSAKRGEKEILELEFYLPDVRKRLAELEGKHPFLYKHHHKGGNIVNGSNSRAKRVKESPETQKNQKKKIWRSPQASSRPPSSSSSASRKGLPAPISDRGRRSPPVQGKRSPSVNYSRSPSLRSTSSGSLGFRKRTCSPVGATYRSALDRFVDEAVFPSEEVKLPSDSIACRDTFGDESGFPPHNPKLSLSDCFKHRQRYVDDFRFLSEKSKLSSGHDKSRSSIEKYVNGRGFSPHTSKLLASEDARCRSTLENYVDELGFPSPKTPLKPSADDYSSWIAHGSDTGEDTGKTLLEGFVVHSDRSEDVEAVGPASFFEELNRQRLQGDFYSQRGCDSIVDFRDDDEISLPDLISETVHDTRTTSLQPQKRRSLSSRSNGKGKRQKDSGDTMWSNFQELGSALDDFDYRTTSSSSAGKNAREPGRNELETERALAGLALTENLEEALKRLGSLQESDESFEEADKEKTLLKPYSVEFPLKIPTTDMMATDAEVSNFVGASSRRALFGENAEARRVSFNDLTWSENDRRLEDFEYDGADSKKDLQKKQTNESDKKCLGDRADFKEKFWEESGIWESRNEGQKDDIAAEGAPDTDNVYEGGKEKSKERNLHNLGSTRMKADNKKKVKFEKGIAGMELDDCLEPDSISDDNETQPDAGGRSLNSRHSSSGTGDAVSQLEKLQVKHFVGKQNHAQHSAGEDGEGALHSKPTFTMSNLSSLSQDALSSSFSSSASCGAVPSFHYSESFRSLNSLGRLSPSWDSSFNNTFGPQCLNLVSDEVDAPFYHHQRGSSKPQQLTFCNPVFDFDSTLSSKAYSESISRPMFDPCDVDEERLKSILGDCSYVASQLNIVGEAERGSMGPGSGFLADTHRVRKTPSPVVKSQARSNGFQSKDVCGDPLDQSDEPQTSELTQRMDGFQRMLSELKETVQSSSIHVEEQVDLCQAKVKGMERQLDALRMETSSELLGLKSFVKSNLDIKVEKGGNRKDISIDGFLEEKMQNKLDECTLKSDSLQKQVDCWLSRMQVELRNQVEEAVASSVEKFESSFKTDLEKLELQRLRDLGNLKKEMGLKLSLHESKEQLNKRTEKQLDFIVEDALEKQFSHFLEIISAKREKEFTEIKNELSHLKGENKAHHKGRAEVREHMEIMTQHMQEVKTRLDKEDFRSLRDSVRKQLHALRNEGLQVKFLADGMKKETDSQVHDLRLSIDELRIEATECKQKILGLRNMEKLLSEEQADLKRAVEEMQKARHEEQSDIDSLKKLKDVLEKCRSSEAAEREGTLIMERVESLSQLYLGGLGEVRTDLKDLKLHFQVKFDELERHWEPLQKLESSTKASFLSSLEARILELEKEHNCTQALENKAEDILSIVGKHRKLASAAATDAAASAHKAEESLAELLGFISSEMNNTKKKSSKLQESLVSDRETSSSILLEMMNISADLCKEKEAALAAASVAKQHIQEVVLNFERELAKLRLDQSQVEKDRDSLKGLAEEMAGSATKAKDFLHEMMEMKQKSVELSGEVLTELTQTRRKSTELAEEVVAEMINIKQKSMELSQEVVAEMSDAKRKSVEFGQEVLGEITNTRRVGLQLQETSTKEMATLHKKAEEMLAEVSRARRKSVQIQEEVAAKAATWASRAEELIADITTASNKTAQCKEVALKEAAVLTDKAEEILAEMVSLRRKSTQLHEDTSEVLKNAVQVVQEQCDLETREWKEAMEGDMKKVRSFGVEIEKMKTSTLSLSNTENEVMKNDFAQHVARTDNALKDLTDSVNGLIESIGPLSKCSSGEHNQTRNDVKHLNQRVETMASMLEAMFRLNAKPGEVKLQDLLPQWQQLTGGCSFSELEKRILRLEEFQLDLSIKSGEVQRKAEELEKSVSIWLPKYDAAARVLNEVEGRLIVLETSARNDVKSEKRLSELDEKEPFLSFYKDLGSGKNTDEGRWSPLETERTSHNMDVREKGVVKSLDARIIILESRIEHVASATYTNLRLLDTKVEHINGSLETALESATMAEKKCNLLGAELVKVFRMLANSGKSSPEKSFSSSKGGESCFRNRFVKPDAMGNKRKEPHLSARTNLKKNVSQDKIQFGGTKVSEHNGQGVDKSKVKSRAESFGKPFSGSFQHREMHAAAKGFETHPKDGPLNGGSDIETGTKKAFSVLRCNFETFESEDDCHGSEANSTNFQTRLNKFADKWTQAPKECQESSACTTDGPQGNGKLGDTVKEPHLRVHTKADGTDQDSNVLKNSQKAEFHINSGRVHVNVSHKSRLFK